MTKSYSIQHLPKEDRPRERLMKFGPEALSTAELIAILLGSGTKELPVLQLAQKLVMRFGSLSKLAEATVEEICQIKGIGMAKAIQLRASLTLGLRAMKQPLKQKYKINNPSHAYHLLKDELTDEKRELFIAVLQDVKGYVINHQVIAIGTLSNALVHPREVFYPAIRHKAASMIVAHNHPSGDPTPSKEDYEVTKTLVDVGRLMNIPVHDHIIIADGGYVSLRQHGFSFT